MTGTDPADDALVLRKQILDVVKGVQPKSPDEVLARLRRDQHVAEGVEGFLRFSNAWRALVNAGKLTRRRGSGSDRQMLWRVVS